MLYLYKMSMIKERLRLTFREFLLHILLETAHFRHLQVLPPDDHSNCCFWLDCCLHGLGQNSNYQAADMVVDGCRLVLVVVMVHLLWSLPKPGLDLTHWIQVQCRARNVISIVTTRIEKHGSSNGLQSCNLKNLTEQRGIGRNLENPLFFQTYSTYGGNDVE